MLNNLGHILTDDVVVNYKKSDRDDCLHFLTHLDPVCKDLSLLVSPTAKRIYTSIFNAWFLKMNFDVKHIDVQGFDVNKSYKITFKGNKYIYSFIDSKFTTGSVALLLHGSFGTYLYTGNFCYYPSFLLSPVLLPVIKEKALTRLYLDNTYYERPSNFLGFHDLTTKVAELIKSQPMKNFYIYADKVTMDPLLADIASKLQEKVYVCQSTMEIMKILGYESCFTRHSNESRIFIDKAFIKKRGFGLDNIAIYINRYSESCRSFQKIERKGNVYNFNFYSHSNHKEICELLRILKPESMTFLFSEIDNSKLSYDFKFKYDFPRTVLFNGISTKPLINVEDEKKLPVKNIPRKLMKPSIINNKDFSENLSNEKNSYSENQELLILNSNDEDKTPSRSTSENHNVSNLSKEYICPLRIRKVPEINSTGLTNESNCNIKDSDTNVTANISVNSNPLYNNSNKKNNLDRNASNLNVQAENSLKFFHSNHKYEPNTPVQFIKLPNNDSFENASISCNSKSLTSHIVKAKTGAPLVFNPRLVKENRLNTTNSKVMQVSNIGMLSDGKKNTIVLNRKYVGEKKPYLISVPANGIQKTKLNDIDNEKLVVTKKTLSLLKSKTTDTNSSMKRPNALLQPASDVLNLTKLFHGWMDNDTISTHNISQTSENIDEPDESISVPNCDKDNLQLEDPSNNIIDVDKNSDILADNINLPKEHNIHQPSGIPAELHQHDNEPSYNECVSSNDDSTKILEKRTMDDKACPNRSPCKLNNDSEVEPFNESNLKICENEICKTNCLCATKDSSNVIPKRHLSDDENGQVRKKLRSDNLRLSQLQSSCQQKEPLLLRDCRVVIRRNGFERSYFFSSKHNCYLPKFFGFKKHEVRPRNVLLTLRNLQKL